MQLMQVTEVSLKNKSKAETTYEVMDKMQIVSSECWESFPKAEYPFTIDYSPLTLQPQHTL